MWVFDFKADIQLHNLHTNEYCRLDNTESKLLTLLLIHQNKIVTKTEIFAYIWPNKIVSEASITQAIKKLRLSLSDCAREQIIIRTIPKLGYALMPNNVKFVTDEAIDMHNVMISSSINWSAVICSTSLFLLNIIFFYFLFVPSNSTKTVRLESFTIKSNSFQVKKNDRASRLLVEAIAQDNHINNVNFYITSNQSRLYIACYKKFPNNNQQRSYNFSIDINRINEDIDNEVLEKCQ
ncbi:winged helix-turn-helix domain-containing protein [Vibrio genomosp. F6]|uniref:Amidase n=1 Tax=Vibrio genomosp. F6 str. FF-238 TaxID=1191298 RepID=A0A1E5CXD0_9VIBR|nr:winged helix-turn-helix domain-containing protein [Vibrio genomosp. F6]OEE74603.1 amidase [Vibrio genomosp. F6 str. FF-238]